MKRFYAGFLSAAILGGIIATPQANAYWVRRRYHPWIAIDPFPVVVAPAPVVVAPQPVLVQESIPDPEAVAPSANYGKILSDTHAQVKQLRTLLDRQLAKGGLTQTQYDREAEALDRAAKEEHDQAVANRGALTPNQVMMFKHRIDEIHEKIQQDLAE